MRKNLVASLVLLFTLCAVTSAHAQATNAADQPLALSVFGGVNGVYTGIPADTGSGQGKNIGITAGVDLRISHIDDFLPSVELRGSYPIHKGSIDSQKLVLGGLKLAHPILNGRVHPYGDILYGRGEIDYQGSGYYVPATSLIYYYTVSNVFSPGLGVDLDINHYFALKLDAQFQHFDTPVNTSGAVWAKALTVGVVYNFDFNRPIIQPRRR
jgi:hypothetical protein